LPGSQISAWNQPQHSRVPYQAEDREPSTSKSENDCPRVGKFDAVGNTFAAILNVMVFISHKMLVIEKKPLYFAATRN
jgi:hypothetical protein